MMKTYKNTYAFAQSYSSPTVFSITCRVSDLVLMIAANRCCLHPPSIIRVGIMRRTIRRLHDRANPRSRACCSNHPKKYPTDHLGGGGTSRGDFGFPNSLGCFFYHWVVRRILMVVGFGSSDDGHWGFQWWLGIIWWSCRRPRI